MDPCDSRNDLSTIGEFAVYPGHPVTLALVIVRTHESFEAANTYKEGFAWPHAVGCNAVPGAGGNVHAAMDLLVRWSKGEDLDKLVERADQTWASCDGQKDGGGSYAKTDVERRRFIGRWNTGQEQADRLKPMLAEALKSWPRAT